MVIGQKCENGIKVLNFSIPSGPYFHYDPPTSNSLGDQPTLGRSMTDK